MCGDKPINHYNAGTKQPRIHQITLCTACNQTATELHFQSAHKQPICENQQSIHKELTLPMQEMPTLRNSSHFCELNVLCHRISSLPMSRTRLIKLKWCVSADPSSSSVAARGLLGCCSAAASLCSCSTTISLSFRCQLILQCLHLLLHAATCATPD